MIESFSKGEVLDIGWKQIYILIESSLKFKMGKSIREMVNWLIKRFSKLEMGNGSRKVIHTLVEIFSKGKMGDSGRNVVP